MVEQVFPFGTGQRIEKLLRDENLHYIHMLFPQGEGLPEHNANATLYMTVLRGTLSITLDGQEPHIYDGGTLLKIPKGTLMTVTNQHPRMLELIVVKAPAPTV